MPPILVVAFTDEEGAVSWRTFSSTDENRAAFRLRKETMYTIGYQESHPDDKTTTYGYIVHCYIRSCDISLEYRASGIQLVLTPDNEPNWDFGFLTATESYPHAIPEGHAAITMAHTFIDPNPFYTAMSDSDSDADSDSDSD